MKFYHPFQSHICRVASLLILLFAGLPILISCSSSDKSTSKSDENSESSPCDTQKGSQAKPLVYHSDKITGMKLVKIEAGYFWMGSKEGEGEEDEMPRHCVHITKDFYLAETEMTKEQYDKVIPIGGNIFGKNIAKMPVAAASWQDITALLSELNKKNKSSGGKGAYRLPTEAEWEYAARAGTDTKYFWGDKSSELDDFAWHSMKDKTPSALAVQQKSVTPWGLYDIYGNVMEFVQDWYGPYSNQTAVQDDPKGPESGSKHLLRGGSYELGAEKINSTYRTKDSGIRSSAVGFRLVWEPPAP